MSEQVAKKATVGRVAELAMRLGGRHLAGYGMVRSQHDFTQLQVLAIADAMIRTIQTTGGWNLERVLTEPNEH